MDLINHHYKRHILPVLKLLCWFRPCPKLKSIFVLDHFSRADFATYLKFGRHKVSCRSWSHLSGSCTDYSPKRCQRRLSWLTYPKMSKARLLWPSWETNLHCSVSTAQASCLHWFASRLADFVLQINGRTCCPQNGDRKWPPNCWDSLTLHWHWRLGRTSFRHRRSCCHSLSSGIHRQALEDSNQFCLLSCFHLTGCLQYGSSACLTAWSWRPRCCWCGTCKSSRWKPTAWQRDFARPQGCL